MVNTLFLPEIREMLAEDNQQELREFCSAIHPAGTAEFMGGLTPDETWRVLQFADEQTRGEIFLYFDRDRQIELIQQRNRQEVADLMQNVLELSLGGRRAMYRCVASQAIGEAENSIVRAGFSIYRDTVKRLVGDGA